MDNIKQGKFRGTIHNSRSVANNPSRGTFSLPAISAIQRKGAEDEGLELKSTMQLAMPEEDELQMKSAGPLKNNTAGEVSQRKDKDILLNANHTGMPDQLKSGIENLSGYSMDDVKVHYNSAKPAQLNASAYAQGTDIHIAPGQERHLPHEAWHVVQQKQGWVRPTMQMKGGVNVKDEKGLESEADFMGNKAASVLQGKIEERAIQRVNSILLPNEKTVQRVKELPYTTTTGTEYDAKKYYDLKSKEMQKFANLPGYTDNAEHFTWHHIIPQSHITKSHANDQLLIRLGPSTSYRIDDPGNEYTDPNYNPDGTHTPFSKEAEGIFEPSAPLDHSALAQKLNALVSKSDHKREEKSYADPGQWFIKLDILLQADNLDSNDKEALSSLADLTYFFIKGEKQTAKAISWQDLKKGKISESLFGKIDKKIKAEKKVFFRGYKELDEITKKVYEEKRILQEQNSDLIKQAFDKDGKISVAIKSEGYRLVFFLKTKRLANAHTKAADEVIKSQGLNQLHGTEHRYFLGSGNVNIDNPSYKKAANITDAVKDSIKDRKTTSRVLVGADTAEDEHILRTLSQGNKDETEQNEPDPSGVASLADELKKEYKSVTQLPDKTVKGTFILNDSELNELKGYERIIKDKKSKKGDTKDLKKNLIQKIKARSKQKDFYTEEAKARIGEVLAQKRKEAHKQKIISNFRESQDKTIDTLNKRSVELIDFYGEKKGLEESKQIAEFAENYNFLEQYWPDFGTQNIALKEELNKIELEKPASLDSVNTSKEKYQGLVSQKIQEYVLKTRGLIASYFEKLEESGF